jgi:cyclohexyl-isocyanide hydratase
VVIDRNRVTGGGVTAGIDFGLRLAAELRGEAIAQQIQLQMEYSPAPPLDAGSPATAPKDVVEAVRRAAAPLLEKRRKFADQWRRDEMTRNAAVTSAASG